MNLGNHSLSFIPDPVVWYVDTKMTFNFGRDSIVVIGLEFLHADSFACHVLHSISFLFWKVLECCCNCCPEQMGNFVELFTIAIFLSSNET